MVTISGRFLWYQYKTSVLYEILPFKNLEILSQATLLEILHFSANILPSYFTPSIYTKLVLVLLKFCSSIVARLQFSLQ